MALQVFYQQEDQGDLLQEDAQVSQYLIVHHPDLDLMLLFQVAGDFELDLLALAERAEEEEEKEKQAEEKRREVEELQDVLVAEEDVTANYPLPSHHFPLQLLC